MSIDLHCAAVCCSVLQCVAVCCSVLPCVAVCCSVLQCVAVCCSVLQCVVLQCTAVCCSVLQCVCSVIFVFRKFWKASSLLNALSKIASELTFENVCSWTLNRHEKVYLFRNRYIAIHMRMSSRECLFCRVSIHGYFHVYRHSSCVECLVMNIFSFL